MADLREVTIAWTVTQSATPIVSVLHFTADTFTAAQQTAAVRTALDAMKGQFNNATAMRVLETGKVIDSATGALQGFWSVPAITAVFGTSTSAPVPGASQILLRENTAVIRDRRQVKGRVFIPGASIAAVGNGEVSPATATAIAAAWSPLTSSLGWVVWSRPRVANPQATPPVTAREGFASTIQTVSVWNEFAVLRRRR